MTALNKDERKTIINFFFKRTNLYTWIGRIFAIALITELAALTLPKELTPDYSQLIIEHGLFLTYVIAFFLGKYFGGYAIISLIIKVLVLWMCLHYNYKLENQGKDYVLIKNWNFGFKNSIITNINIDKDEKEDYS